MEKRKGGSEESTGGGGGRRRGSQVCDPVSCWLGCAEITPGMSKKKKKTSFPRDDSEVELLTLKKFLHVFAMGMKKMIIFGVK